MLTNSTITETLIDGRILTPDGLDLSPLKDATAFGRKTAEIAAWALLWEIIRRYNATYHVPPNGRWVFVEHDHWKAEAELFAQTILREWSGRDFSWLPKVKIGAYTDAPPRVGPVSNSIVGRMPWIKGRSAIYVYKRWGYTRYLIDDDKDSAPAGSNIRSLIPEEKQASYCGPVFVTGIAPARMHLTSQEVRPPRPPTPSDEVPTAEPGDERAQRKLEIQQEIAMLQSELDSSEDDEYLRTAYKRKAVHFRKLFLEPPPRYVIGDRLSKKKSLLVETATVSATPIVQPSIVPEDEQIARSDERTPTPADHEALTVHAASRRAARAFFRGPSQPSESILSQPSSVESSPNRNGTRTPMLRAGSTSYGPKMIHGRPSLPGTPPVTPLSSNYSSPTSHSGPSTVNQLRPKANAD